MPCVSERAPAKINLDLCVVGRRGDGYHELDSLVVFADLADRLTFQDDERLDLDFAGPFADALADPAENLVLRAARLLAEHVDRKPAARIALEKRIPVAAGLGGGSADAAAALRGLNRLWRLRLTPADLQQLALRLGADVPVCLASRPARMRGIGERLEPIDGLPELPLLLVNPGLSVPTREVFAALGDLIPTAAEASLQVFDRTRLLAWLRARENHLEAPARRLAPVIGEVLTALAEQPGCTLARMSGSGATCFGLFEDRRALEGAVIALGRSRPTWWVEPTTACGRQA